MNYENKFTTHNIPEVTFPDGLRDETKYTFSITYEGEREEKTIEEEKVRRQGKESCRQCRWW